MCVCLLSGNQETPGGIVLMWDFRKAFLSHSVFVQEEVSCYLKEPRGKKTTYCHFPLQSWDVEFWKPVLPRDDGVHLPLPQGFS